MEGRPRRRCGEQKQNYVKIFTHTHTERETTKLQVSNESNRIALI